MEGTCTPLFYTVQNNIACDFQNNLVILTYKHPEVVQKSHNHGGKYLINYFENSMFK